MTEKRLEKALETLESFNDAVLAARMYPVTAPHATATFKRALQDLSSYIGIYHQLHCGFVDKKPLVQGIPLPADMNKAAGELFLFLQLELLDLQHLQLNLDFSEEVFRKLLFIFTSRKEKIAREGGGRAFVKSMGMSQYFPESIEDQKTTESRSVKKRRVRFIALHDLASLPEHLVPTFLEDASLSEKAGREFVELRDEQKISLMLQIFQSILSASLLEDALPELYPALTEAVSRFDKLLSDKKKPEMTKQFALMLFKRVSETEVYGAILLQPMQNDFGMQLQDNLFALLSKEQRIELTEMLGKQVDRLDKNTEEGKELFERIVELISSLKKDAGSSHIAGNAGRDDKLREELLALLDSQEVINLLPAEIDKYLNEGEIHRVRQLLQLIQEKVDNSADEKAETYNGAFCLVTDLLIKRKGEALLFDHVDFFINWLETSDQADFFFEKYAEALHSIANYALQEGDFSSGLKIVHVFAAIRNGEIKKSAPVKAMAARIQDRMVTPDLLDGLAADYLQNNQQNPTGPLLIALGMNGLVHLLNVLINVENRDSRFALIDLLKTAGSVLPTAILKILNQKQTWYAKRNLLQLLATTGDSSHGQRVADIGRDSDLRVQSEALRCLKLIGGSKLKDLLLQVLEYIADDLKVQVLEALGPISDETVVDRLLDFLKRNGGLKAAASKAWFDQICLVLSQSHSEEARNCLQAFISESKNDKAIPKPAIEAAEQTLGSISLSPDGKKEDSPVQEQKVSAAENMTKPQPLGITFLPKEKEAQALFAQGKNDEAVDLVMDLITQTARQRKFDQADKLREWLLASAPMALIKAIQAAEIIQEEKSQAIDSSHIEVWSDLYDVLSSDEFSTLYHSMQHRRYGAGQVIIEQHSRMPALFFVNRGRVKLHYSDKGSSEVLVRIAGPGDIIGVDTFFNASLWTITASTMGHADVSMLRLDSQKKWNEEFPALESKLHDFCLQYESLQDFFKNTKKDRRQSERKKIEGRVATVVLDAERQPTNVTAKGDLFDISRGGISFYMRMSMKDQAHVLLGQQIRVFMSSAEVVPGKVVPLDGMVVAVRGHLVMENEYSVHVSFEENLDSIQVQRFIKTAQGLSTKR